MIKKYSLGNKGKNPIKAEAEKSSESRRLSNFFDENIHKIREILKDCPDIVMRRVNLRDDKTGYFIYVDGLINTDLIQRDFIGAILGMEYSELQDIKNIENLPIASIGFPADVEAIIDDILSSNTVFIGEGINYAISCNLTEFPMRSIEEPITEKNVKGSHEGFVESLEVNIVTLRRRIKNTSLKFRMFKLGTTTNQNVAIAYIEGIANPSILKLLSEKINGVNFDGLIAIGYIQQFISDHPNSPFPQYRATERPDVAVAGLLEGRFLILLDGTPVTLIVPVGFWGFLTTVDDYSTNWMFGTLLGVVRFFGIFIGTFLPGIYIAILTFHYYAVPLTLLIPLAESRVKVPFPPIIEALIMEITLEILREASIRLPTYIGSAVGVVGGIVIGQAAVQAGLVSNLMVIVVAVTAIATFLIPNYDMGLAVRLIRFVIMISAAVFGLIGIVVSGVTMLAHLVSLESLGQPYLQPLAPFKFKDLKDMIIRLPLQILRKRPDIAQPIDRKRGKNNG